MSVAAAPREAARPAAVRRLLAGIHRDRPVSLDEHLARLGPLRAVDLLAEVQASGLRGRGGGGFPAGRKFRAVAAGRRSPVVVVNATEAEPVSRKDKALLRHVPHHVLDGAVAAVAALGGRTAIVVLGERAVRERAVLEDALAERRRRGIDGAVDLQIGIAPDRFVAGEETALINLLNGRPAKPSFRPPLPFERGVGDAPTLVQNAETLAHVAMIARFGSDWFGEIGTADEPGTALLTVTGAVGRPGVYEFPFGVPIRAVLADAGGVAGGVKACLVGGYFGSWVRASRLEPLSLTSASLAGEGLALGAGAVFVLPPTSCGVVETARVARYLAAESAGQCGPCVHGLNAVADAMTELAGGRPGDRRPQLRRWLAQVSGRGACRHPDGATRFVASALEVFADEVELHLEGRCSGHAAHALPTRGESSG